MKVIQVNQTPKRRASKDEKFISDAVIRITGYLKTKKIRNRILLFKKKEVTVVFLTPPQIKKINSQFRKKYKATDILSFSSADPHSLGELLLCTQVLEKQARAHGHSLEIETAYMLVHGILHLLGYDHELSTAEERLMFRIQDQCFSALWPV